MADVVISEDHASAWVKILSVANLTILGYKGKMVSLLDMEHLVCVIFTEGGGGGIIDERVIIQKSANIYSG